MIKSSRFCNNCWRENGKNSLRRILSKIALALKQKKKREKGNSHGSNRILSSHSRKVRKPLWIYGLPNFSATDLHCERYLSRSCLSRKWFPRRLTPDGNFSKASTGKSNGMHPRNIPHPDPPPRRSLGLFFIFSLGARNALSLDASEESVRALLWPGFLSFVSIHEARTTKVLVVYTHVRVTDRRVGSLTRWNITLSSPSCERAQGQRINL